jgi:hypothetical protein
MKQSLENEVLDDKAVIKKIKHFEVKEAKLESVEAKRLITLKAKLKVDQKKEKETEAVVEADAAKVKTEQAAIDSIEKKVKKGKALEYREEGDFKASLKALKSMLKRNPDGTSQVVPLKKRHRHRRRHRDDADDSSDDDDGSDSNGDSDDDVLGGVDLDEQPRKQRRARSSDVDELEGTNTALDDVDQVLGTGTSGGEGASSSVDLDKSLTHNSLSGQLMPEEVEASASTPAAGRGTGSWAPPRPVGRRLRPSDDYDALGQRLDLFYVRWLCARRLFRMSLHWTLSVFYLCFRSYSNVTSSLSLQ